MADRLFQTHIVATKPRKTLRRDINKFLRKSARQLQLKRAEGMRLVQEAVESGQIKLANSVLDAFSASDTTHQFQKHANKLDRLRHASSFFTLMSLRSRRKQMLGKSSCPEFQVWNKAAGYRFADHIGIRRPSSRVVNTENLVFEPGTVIKPYSGSEGEGVFLIYDTDRVWHVESAEYIDHKELRTRIQEFPKRFPQRRHSWTIEELVTNSSRDTGTAMDWKCYCFYGETHIVGAIQRAPRYTEAWYDKDLAPLDRGFEATEAMAHPVVPDTLLDLAEHIGTSIPAPFIRIDFIESDSGLVLNEFTARPGTIMRYSRHIDQELGDAYLGAEHRLQEDLLGGKRFDAFMRFRDSEANIKPPTKIVHHPRPVPL